MTADVTKMMVKMMMLDDGVDVWISRFMDE